MFVAIGKNGKWKIVGYALIMYNIFYKKTHISKLEFGSGARKKCKVRNK